MHCAEKITKHPSSALESLISKFHLCFQSNGTILKMAAGCLEEECPGQVKEGMLNSYWGVFHLSLLTLSLLSQPCPESNLKEVMKGRKKSILKGKE